jgi:hypothetical protein
VRLPVRVRLKPGAESGGGGEEKETLLEIPGASWGREISLRLSAGDEDGAAVEREGNCVPWGAAALNHPGKSGLVRVRCKRCDNTVVREGGVGEWRDLPNENWAEMMEFWHCHRPDHDHGHGDRKDGGKSKGYAAENQLRALNGVGFVDLGAFLLKEEDCEGVQVSTSLFCHYQHQSGSGRSHSPLLSSFLCPTSRCFMKNTLLLGSKKAAPHPHSVVARSIQEPDIKILRPSLSVLNRLTLVGRSVMEGEPLGRFITSRPEVRGLGGIKILVHYHQIALIQPWFRVSSSYFCVRCAIAWMLCRVLIKGRSSRRLDRPL